MRHNSQGSKIRLVDLGWRWKKDRLFFVLVAGGLILGITQCWLLGQSGWVFEHFRIEKFGLVVVVGFEFELDS